MVGLLNSQLAAISSDRVLKLFTTSFKFVQVFANAMTFSRLKLLKGLKQLIRKLVPLFAIALRSNSGAARCILDLARSQDQKDSTEQIIMNNTQFISKQHCYDERKRLPKLKFLPESAFQSDRTIVHDNSILRFIPQIHSDSNNVRIFYGMINEGLFSETI